MPTGLLRSSLRRRGAAFWWKTKSRECVILSVCFCSARFSTTVCIRCQRPFVAEDLLQNALKNDRFLERTLLCSCTKHKMCYPRLIPSFLVSVMTWGPSHKAGLVGRRANFGLNPGCFSQRRVKFKLSSVAMVSNAACQTSKRLFLSGLVDKCVQKDYLLADRLGGKWGHHFYDVQRAQKHCTHLEVQRNSK